MPNKISYSYEIIVILVLVSLGIFWLLFSIILKMENFQLREGSSRRANNAFRNLSNNTGRSFISTSLVSESTIGGE